MSCTCGPGVTGQMFAGYQVKCFRSIVLAKLGRLLSNRSSSIVPFYKFFALGRGQPKKEVRGPELLTRTNELWCPRRPTARVALQQCPILPAKPVIGHLADGVKFNIYQWRILNIQNPTPTVNYSSRLVPAKFLPSRDCTADHGGNSPHNSPA